MITDSSLKFLMASSVTFRAFATSSSSCSSTTSLLSSSETFFGSSLRLLQSQRLLFDALDFAEALDVSSVVNCSFAHGSGLSTNLKISAQLCYTLSRFPIANCPLQDKLFIKADKLFLAKLVQPLRIVLVYTRAQISYGSAPQLASRQLEPQRFNRVNRIDNAYPHPEL